MQSGVRTETQDYDTGSVRPRPPRPPRPLSVELWGLHLRSLAVQETAPVQPRSRAPPSQPSQPVRRWTVPRHPRETRPSFLRLCDPGTHGAIARRKVRARRTLAALPWTAGRGETSGGRPAARHQTPPGENTAASREQTRGSRPPGGGERAVPARRGKRGTGPGAADQPSTFLISCVVFGDAASFSALFSSGGNPPGRSSRVKRLFHDFW